MVLENSPDGIAVLDSNGGKTSTGALDDTSRAALESKIADRMSIFKDDDAPQEDDSQDNSQENLTEDNATDSSEETADPVEQDQETEQSTEADGVDETLPTLPAAVIRSLKAYEWTDEEIKNALKTGGQSFVISAQKLHNTRNAETAKWAEIGRSQRQQQQTQQVQQPEKKEQPSGLVPKLDAAALKEHYGEDALIDKILGPVNAAIDKINNEIMPTVQKSQLAAQQAEQRALFDEMEKFFNGADLKPFEKLYGKASDSSFSDEHIAARNKVIEYADALTYGAAKQGRQLSVHEALTLAHDAVSGEFKTQAAKEQLTQNLVQRQRGITLKPGNKSVAKASGGPKNRTELEKSVGSKLAAAFRST